LRCTASRPTASIDGEYRRRETMARGGSVTPLFDDSLSFEVNAVLPQDPSDEDE